MGFVLVYVPKALSHTGRYQGLLASRPKVRTIPLQALGRTTRR